MIPCRLWIQLHAFLKQDCPPGAMVSMVSSGDSDASSILAGGFRL